MWLFIYSRLKFSRTPEKRRNGEGANKTKRKEKDKKKGKGIMPDRFMLAKNCNFARGIFQQQMFTWELKIRTI